MVHFSSLIIRRDGQRSPLVLWLFVRNQELSLSRAIAWQALVIAALIASLLQAVDV